MADVTEVIKRLIVEAQTRGLDKAAADFEKFGATAKQAAATTENSLASTGKSFERLAGSIDPARKQLQMLAKDLATLESGRGRAGVSDEYINGLKEARIASANLAIEAAKTNAAIGAQANGFAKMGPRIGLAGHELRNLGMQANDAATMLLSGSSAFQVMATQGGQVLQVLQGGNGVTANLKSLGSNLLGMITPARVAFGGIAAGAALAAVSVIRYQQGQQELRASLAGIGRQSGATIGQLNSIAEASAAAGGVSVASAREMVGAYAAVGKIGPDNFAELIKVQKNYAATTKQEIPAATAELAKAIASPLKGFDELSKTIGVGSAATREQIENLENSGQKLEAQKILIDAVNASVVKGAQATGIWAKAWEAFTTDASNASDALGKFLSKAAEPIPLDKRLPKIEQARERITNPEREQRPNFSPSNFTPTRSIDEQTAALDRQRQKEIELADAVRKRAERQEEANLKAAADSRSLTAVTAIESVFPDIGKMSDVERKINDIKLALKDQEQGWSTLSEAQRRAGEQALESLQVQQQAMRGGKFAGQFGEGPVGDRMARREEDQQAKIGGIGASGAEATAAAAAEQALIQARRQGMGSAKEFAQIESHTLGTARAQEAAALRDQNAAAAANLQSIQARTAEERASAAATQAYVSAIASKAGEERAAAAASNAYAASIAQVNAGLAQTVAANYSSVEVSKAEIAAIGMSASAREAYLAGVRAEQQLIQQGVDLHSRYAQEVIRSAQAAGEWKGRVQEAQQAPQAQQQAQKSAASFADQQLESINQNARAQHEADKEESKRADQRERARQDSHYSAMAAERELASAWGSFAASMSSLVGGGKSLNFIAPGPGLANMQAVESMKARLAALSSRGANDNSAITGPLKSLLGSAAGTRESAQKSLLEEQKDFAKYERDLAKQAARDARDAAKAQKEAAEEMKNAAKNDPRQDPYMARNASIYYGVESASFFEEISWGKATANAAEQALEQNRDAAQDAAEDAAEARADRLEQLAEAQAANDIANQQYAELQSIAASTGGLGPMIAALAAAGYAASAEAMQKAVDDAKKQSAIDSLQRQIAQREANMGGSFSSTGGGIPTYGSGLSFAPVVDKPKISSSYGGAFAEGGYLGAGRWGIAGEAGPEVVRGPAQIDPIRGGGTTVVVNQTNHIHGVSEPERVPEQLRGLVSSATEAAQIRSAMRSAA